MANNVGRPVCQRRREPGAGLPLCGRSVLKQAAVIVPSLGCSEPAQYHPIVRAVDRAGVAKSSGKTRPDDLIGALLASLSESLKGPVCPYHDPKPLELRDQALQLARLPESNPDIHRASS